VVGFLSAETAARAEGQSEKGSIGLEVKVETLEKIGYQLLPKFKLLTKRPVLQERTVTLSSDGRVSGASTKDVFPSLIHQGTAANQQFVPGNTTP